MVDWPIPFLVNIRQIYPTQKRMVDWPNLWTGSLHCLVAINVSLTILTFAPHSPATVKVLGMVFCPIL